MNRTVVLTGATGRIGRHIAKNLAKAGSNLALVCRDEAAGEAMAKELRLHNPQSLVNVHCCDLTSTEAVRGLAAELHNSYPRVHSLVNAAGIMSPSPEREVSVDGIEKTFHLNALAPFQLTSLPPLSGR